MFALDKVVAPVIAGAVDAAWAQWHVLSPVLAGRARESHAMVDPEGLILGSLALASQERRLSNVVLSWWARTGTTLLSVQRLKNLAKDYPPAISEPLAGFARTALENGDLRWGSLAGREPALRAREKDLKAAPAVQDPRALVLRLRRGFGVGIKADVVAYLLGAYVAKTVPAITRETGYHERAVRRAVEELVAGGFVQGVPSSPATYKVDMNAWRPLLKFGNEPPLWRGWRWMYAFVAQLQAWVDEQGRVKPSAYVLSSRARDFMEVERHRLHGHLNLPKDRGAVGEDYLAAFEQNLGEVLSWMEACA